MLTENCIYTIRNSSHLRKSHANGRCDEYEEDRNWKTGKRLLDEAHRSGRRLPIIFAPAEDTRQLFAWAFIDGIAPGATTRYSFSELRLFADGDRPAKSTRRKASNGERLDKNFNRPYAICRTPSYLAEFEPPVTSATTRFWLCHWQKRLWRDDVNAEYAPVCSSGSNMFGTRGVSVGDVAYVVSLSDGYLLLGGRMTAKRILSRRQAARLLGTNRLYDAAEWIVDEGEEGTPLNLHRRLDPSLSRQLRFLTSSGEEKALFFTSEVQLDSQSTRGVRELSPSSAALLDWIIALTDNLPRSAEMITVTEDSLDLLGEAVDLQHEAIEENAQLFREGSVQRSLATRYERKRCAREKCVEHYGAVCSICGFEFASVYDDIMADFIHVHHHKQLSDRKRTGQEMSDPIKDLIPLCPNCHAVVHRKNPPYLLRRCGSFGSVSVPLWRAFTAACKRRA